MSNDVKIVKNKSVKINFRYICDWWFPIYVLPFINLYKWSNNTFSIDFGWICFKIEITLYY